jgi:hypothetical protein
VNPTVSTAIFLDSRADVDKTIADGLAAGGAEVGGAVQTLAIKLEAGHW